MGPPATDAAPPDRPFRAWLASLPQSLSLRLLGIFALTTFCSLLVLVLLFTKGLGSQWRDTIEPHFVQYLTYIQRDLGDPPDPARAEALATRLPVSIVIYKGSNLLFSSEQPVPAVAQLRYREIPVRKLGLRSGAERPQGIVSISADRGGRNSSLRIEQNGYTVYYRFRRVPRHSDARSQHDHSAWRASDKSGSTPPVQDKPAHSHWFNNELMWALLLLGAIMGVSYWLIRRQLSPIGKIQSSVARMTRGELDHRIKLHGNHDLAELGNSIDTMAERIEAMLDAKRQLLLALSHELRSPLARARLALELLPESKHRDTIAGDLLEMRSLITEIIESEQLQQSHSVLNLSVVELTELVEHEIAGMGNVTLNTIDIVAPEIKGTSLALDRLTADGPRLRILVRNLIGNAQLHGRATDGAADISVTIAGDQDHVTIEVADAGPGIQPEDLERITDPLYRPDTSRTRSSGGFGLGLTLARLIAEAHRGTLTVHSEPAIRPGTRVQVMLPRSQS